MVTTITGPQTMAITMGILEETAAAKAAAVVAAAAEDASAGAITKSARSLASVDLTRLAHAERELILTLTLTLTPILAERAPSTPPAHAPPRSIAPSPARRARNARSLSPVTKKSPSLARRSPRSARRWSRRSSLSLPAGLAPADRGQETAAMTTVSEDDRRRAYTTS